MKRNKKELLNKKKLPVNLFEFPSLALPRSGVMGISQLLSVKHPVSKRSFVNNY
jgi:hypothetical protein